MHKGKPYPYLTPYWATNFLFRGLRAGRRAGVWNLNAPQSDFDQVPQLALAKTMVGNWDAALRRLRYAYLDPLGHFVINMDWFDGGDDPGSPGKFVYTVGIVGIAFGRVTWDCGFNVSQQHEWFSDAGGAVFFTPPFFFPPGATVAIATKWLNYAEGGYA